MNKLALVLAGALVLSGCGISPSVPVKAPTATSLEAASKERLYVNLDTIEAHLKRCAELEFENHDVDKDGKLKFFDEELGTGEMVGTSYHVIGNLKFKANTMDEDRDGFVSRQEYMGTYLSNRMVTAFQTAIYSHFKFFDLDKDLMITKTEWDGGFRLKGPPHGVRIDHMRLKDFQDGDKDQDGNLTPLELSDLFFNCRYNTLMRFRPYPRQS